MKIKNVLSLCLFILLCLVGSGSIQAQNLFGVKVTYLDNSEQAYAIKPDGKIWFENSELRLQTQTGSPVTSISLSVIRKLTLDTDGITTSTADVSNSSQVAKIYPNPASTYFEIVTTEQAMLDIRVFDTRGALLLSGKYANRDKVEISSLDPGLYVVVVNNQSFKLIKR